MRDGTASSSDEDKAGVIAPPPLIFASVLLAGLLFNRAYPIPVMPEPWATIIGAALIVLSIVLSIWAAMEFRRAETAVNPYKPTTAIIGRGPYRFTRNPLYLAMAVCYIGVSLFLNAFWPLPLLPIALLIVQLGVIRREERYLERKFGGEYTSYRSHVRRWL